MMHLWFVHLFESRMNQFGFVSCFECGKLMHKDTYINQSTCYSHILGKKQYPAYAGEEWNVKIVHPDCHHLYSMKPQKALKQYSEYLKLKKELNL